MKATVTDEWITLFNNADYFNVLPPGFTIVTIPDSENWCIDNQLLSLGNIDVVMEFTSGPYWVDVVFVEKLKKCVRPFKLFDGSLLREVTSGLRVGELSESTRSVINYGIHNLTYELQINLVESCKLEEPDIAVEELREFICHALCQRNGLVWGQPLSSDMFQSFHHDLTAHVCASLYSVSACSINFSSLSNALAYCICVK